MAPSSSLPAKGSSSPAAAAAAATQAFAILEGAQEHAAKEILKEVDVVVCSCIGAGNDAFVRAIGGDQERRVVQTCSVCCDCSAQCLRKIRCAVGEAYRL